MLVSRGGGDATDSVGVAVVGKLVGKPQSFTFAIGNEELVGGDVWHGFSAEVVPLEHACS